MKNKFTKVISFIMSAVMTVSTLTTLASSAEMGYETDEGNRASTPASLNDDVLFGSLKFTETDKSVEVENQPQNPDYTIYRVKHDRKTSNVEVNYHAVEDCILFVGIYNDDGTQLHTSITQELTASDDGDVELIIPDVLPDHYLVKAFLVGKMMQDPLSKPAFYNKETKVMQDILSTTTEDFEEDDTVINLDKDKDNNFFVLQDDIIEVKTAGIYIETDDNGCFKFKKCNEISALKKGDKAVVYTEQGIISFIVEKSESNGDTIIITPDSDADVGEIFKFIKIDTMETAEYEAVKEETDDKTSNQPEPKSAPQDFNVPYPESPKALKKYDLPDISVNLEYEIPNGKNEDLNDTDDLVETDIAATLKIGLTLDVEVYYDISDLYFGFDCTFRKNLDIECKAECKLNAVKFKPKKFSPYSNANFSIPIFGNSIVGITLNPEIYITVSGSAIIKFEAEETIECDTKNGLTHTKKEPIFKELEADVTVDIRFNAAVKIMIVSFDVFTVNLYGGIRFEAKISKSFEKAKNYERHDCSLCVDFDISLYFGISAEAKALWKNWSWPIAEVPINLGKFYWSSDIGWGKGKCKNYSHRIKLKIYDIDTEEPLEGFKVYHQTDNGLDSQIIDTTGSNGEIEVWVNDKYLKDYSYVVTAKKGTYKQSVPVGLLWHRKEEGIQSFNIPIYIPKPNSSSDNEDKKKAEINDITVSYGGKSDVVKSGRLPIEYGEETLFEKPYNGPFTYYSVHENGDCYFWGDGYLQIPDLSKYGAKKAIVIDPNVKMCSDDQTTKYGECEGSWESIDLSIMNFERIPDIFFINLTELKDINLPSGIKTIGRFAFCNCWNLEHINLPDTVERIEISAFDGATGLKSFTCPKNLKVIEHYAFHICKNLTEIKFNYGLEHIGWRAFSSSGLQSVNIPASVKEIGTEAFATNDLKVVTINGDFDVITAYNLGQVKYEVIDVDIDIKSDDKNDTAHIFNSTNMEKIVLNTGVTKIYPGLFIYSSKLKELKLPKTLKYIGAYAFQNTGLTSIEIPDNVVFIGREAFEGAKKLTSVKLPDSPIEVGAEAFAYSKLVSVDIPEKVKSLGYNAFYCTDTLKEFIVRNPQIITNVTNPKYVFNEKKNTYRNEIMYVIPRKDETKLKLTVYGYEGTEAELLANKTNNRFISLNASPTDTSLTTTTTTKTSNIKTTTTTTTTTAATTVVSTVVGANKDCVFIAVKDAATVVSDAITLLDSDNVAYFDQQTADDKGNVSFTFIPDKFTKWTYIFISEVDHLKIYRTVDTPDSDPKTEKFYVADPNVKIYGDTNADGEFDLSDTVMIMQSLANPDKYGINGTDDTHITLQGLTNGDVYDPGSGITMMDALCIQNYLLGNIKSLPVYLNT